MKTRLTVLALLAATLAGCGSSSTPPDATPDPEELSDRLVDFSKKPPYVNSLDIDPKNGEFMLTTNKGFWRIDPKTKAVRQVKGTIEDKGKKDTVGTFLEFEVLDDGRLIGSGHPDSQDTLPQFLGFIESTDEGATWRVLSRLGEADLHKVVDRHDRLYAFDAVLNGMLISEDGGRTFTERFTPPGLIIDFEVDPEDPEYILASGEEELHKTENGGKRWRQLDIVTGVRLAWPPGGGPVVRASQDGTVSHSTDKGATWTEVGKVPGEPYKFEYSADEPDHLFLALSDGTIMETEDRGKTWKEAFRP
jgi:hypothetical protein